MCFLKKKPILRADPDYKVNMNPIVFIQNGLNNKSNYLKVFERFDEKRNEKLDEITELIEK